MPCARLDGVAAGDMNWENDAQEDGETGRGSKERRVFEVDEAKFKVPPESG